MKAFNLQEALAGKPVVTRDGRPVKMAWYNPDAAENCRVLFWDADNMPRVAYEDGRVGVGDVDNLFMASTERKEWIVIEKTIPNFCRRFQHYADALGYSENLPGAIIHEITVTE